MQEVVRQIVRHVYRCGEGSAFLSVRDHHSGLIPVPGIHLRVDPAVAESLKKFEMSTGVRKSMAWRNYYCNQVDKFNRSSIPRLNEVKQNRMFMEENPMALLFVGVILDTFRQIEGGQRGCFWRLTVAEFLAETHRRTSH